MIFDVTFFHVVPQSVNKPLNPNAQHMYPLL